MKTFARTRAGGARDLAEQIDLQLAHARLDAHRRVPAWAGEAGGEDDQRLRGVQGAAAPQQSFDGLEESARATGLSGTALGARSLTGHAARREPDARRVRREGHHDAAKRERGNHRPIGRRERAKQPVDRGPEELFLAGDEGLLIDDEHEAAPGGDIVVRAVRWWQTRWRSSRRRRGGDPPQRPYRSHPIGDADFDVRRLQVRRRETVGVQGDEVDGRTGRALAGDLCLVCRE